MLSRPARPAIVGARHTLPPACDGCTPRTADRPGEYAVRKTCLLGLTSDHQDASADKRTSITQRATKDPFFARVCGTCLSPAEYDLLRSDAVPAARERICQRISTDAASNQQTIVSIGRAPDTQRPVWQGSTISSEACGLCTSQDMVSLQHESTLGSKLTQHIAMRHYCSCFRL